MDSLHFLYNTYHNSERKKIFLTVDQALYDVYQKLEKSRKLPGTFLNFFILILDPFHLQWTMEKCLMSGFGEVLKEMFAILGLDDHKWVGIKDCKNVHKSHAILEELVHSLLCFFVMQYEGQMEVTKKLRYSQCSREEKVNVLAKGLDTFLSEIKIKDKLLSVWVDILNAGQLCLMAWEAQRVENHALFMFAFKQFLPVRISH